MALRPGWAERSARLVVAAWGAAAPIALARATSPAIAEAADGPVQAAPPPAMLVAADGGGCPKQSALAAVALSRAPGDKALQVWLVPLAGGALAKLGTLPQLRDAPVAGVAIPGTSLAAVTVVTRRERDPTWSGALYVLGPDRAPARLVDHVLAGGRPAVAPDGRLFVVRGAAAEPERPPADRSAGFRRDRIRVVAVDPTGGATRTLFGFSGDAAFLIGAIGDELIAYRVGVESARVGVRQEKSAVSAGPLGDFVAVNVGSGAVRSLLAPAPPLARDFSLDAPSERVWFAALRTTTGRDRGWGVFALNAKTGRLSLAVSGDSIGIAPHALPGGRVLYQCPGSGGALCIGSLAGPESEARPLGPGRDEIQSVACTREGTAIMGIHYDRASTRATPFVWNVGAPSARTLDVGAGHVEFIGVVATPPG